LVDTGLGKGLKVDRKSFLASREAYYRINGWDPITGNPTSAKLEELGIEGIGQT
jgi:aldehyde:ferredoxin oxidoreductase